MIDVLGWQRHIVYPGVVDFLDSLKQNKNVGLRHFPGNEETLYARLSHDPELEQVFQRAMASLSSANNKHLIEATDVSAIHHLVDAGGGDGTNAIAITRNNPHLKATVFDIPSVCERAKKVIASSPVADRVSTLPGDLFTDEFPKGTDGILFSHMLIIWSPEKNVLLLKRAYDALPKGGHVFVFTMMANDDGTGPISSALGSVYFMSVATGKGMLYSWSEQEGFLQKAGFKKIERFVFPNAHGLLTGVK
jgi:hypothetical protein